MKNQQDCGPWQFLEESNEKPVTAAPNYHHNQIIWSSKKESLLWNWSLLSCLLNGGKCWGLYCFISFVLIKLSSHVKQVFWHYHYICIAVHWFDGPFDAFPETLREIKCHPANPAFRHYIINFQLPTNRFKHKADWFNKWHSQGAKGHRTKAITYQPLHGGKNRKKWNIWLHLRKRKGSQSEENNAGHRIRQKRKQIWS